MPAPLPDAASVAATLAAIHASAEFARAPVMRHLLGYLIDETLAGRGDRLKAYSVAVDALGRSADFDAQTDSYPRVQVGRLRRMLETFYATSPAIPLRVTIPLGAYRVQFDDALDNTSAAAPVAGSGHRTLGWRSIPSGLIAIIIVLAAIAVGWAYWRHADRGTSEPMLVPPPTLAIEVGETTQGAAERARIGDVTRRIGTAFTRSGIATVVYGGVAVDARYALLLDLGVDGTSLSLRLVDRRSGELEWGDTASLPQEAALLPATIGPYISALVRPSGIIGARQRAEFEEDYRPGYPCMLHYDAYFREREAEWRAPVASCIAQTLKLDPSHAGALAAASFIAIDPAGAPVSQRARTRAAALARRAAVSDPYSPAAVIAEARVAFMEGNCVRGKALAGRAVALGALNPETLGLAGLLLVQCDRAAALTLLRDARRLDPDLTTFYVSALVLLELDAGRPEEAAAIADTMRPPGGGMMRQYLLAQILGEIAVGRDDRAQALWRDLVARTLPPRDTVDAVLSYVYLAPDYRAVLAQRLKLGGIEDRAVAARSP